MLQFITNASDKESILKQIREVIEGGCTWVQLRMKDAEISEIKEVAKEAKEICKEKECILIIDDHVEIAKELELNGVHLGKNDMPVAEARELLGAEFIIGATANTFEDIEALCYQDIDYIGLGPFRFTTTKKNLSPVIGLEGYKEIVEKKINAEIEIPLVAIGGIEYDDVQEIMNTGIDGIAVSGSLIRTDNTIKETEKYISLLETIKIQRYE